MKNQEMLRKPAQACIQRKFRFAVFLATTLGCESAFATDCSSGWEAYSSEPYQQLAMPDTNVKYWRYRFKVEGNKPLYLRISGEFPPARYMNFAVYDQITMNATATLSDFRIKPDDGFTNPFANPYANQYATRDGPDQGKGKYRIALIQKGAAVPGWANGNAIQVPSPRDPDETKAAELWHRIYLPDQPDPMPYLMEGGSNPHTTASLPNIQSVDENGNSMPCPVAESIAPRLWSAFKNMPPADPHGKVIFYASSTDAFYANPDTKYLAGALTLTNGDVAVLRFKAPRGPGSGRKKGEILPHLDVRYWSICISGIDTRTSGCISDRDTKVDPDGFVNLVIGPESMRQAAATQHFNFLAKGRFHRSLIIYRNLLAEKEFQGNFNLVPSTTGKDVSIKDAAENYIGEYAPVGRICSQSQFSERNCGVQASVQ